MTGLQLARGLSMDRPSAGAAAARARPSRRLKFQPLRLLDQLRIDTDVQFDLVHPQVNPKLAKAQPGAGRRSGSGEPSHEGEAAPGLTSWQNVASCRCAQAVRMKAP